MFGLNLPAAARGRKQIRLRGNVESFRAVGCNKKWWRKTHDRCHLYCACFPRRRNGLRCTDLCIPGFSVRVPPQNAQQRKARALRSPEHMRSQRDKWCTSSQR